MPSRVAWLESPDMIWGTGGPKAHAQVFSKQMVYFMCFHYLFLFSGIKARRESHTLPPNFENTSTNISVAGGGCIAETDSRDDDFLFCKML